jgi:hypothetical protein
VDQAVVPVDDVPLRLGHQGGQGRVLAVQGTRTGFEHALCQACLSHYERDRYPDRGAWAAELRTRPVRVQWDP